jgi:hypothetical protein
LQREPVSLPEPVSRLAEGEQRAWPRVSALVWELDDSQPVAALPVLLAADERQVAMAADARQVVDEPQVAMVADAERERALRASVPAQALARVRPGELEWRRVLALEPVADDLAVGPGYLVGGCLGEHWERPVVAVPRRGQELPGRRVCSQRSVEPRQPRLVCRGWRMRTAGDSVRPLAGAVPAWPWEECAVRARRRLRWAAARE